MAFILVIILALLVSFRSLESLAPQIIRIEADLDGDRTMEEYCLSKHRLTVREGEHLLWQSPGNWRIDNLALGDVDNDGTVNLTFSLWKTGSFGPVQPFWHGAKDRSYKNHLFVYKLENKTIKPVWCSSNLDNPLISFTIEDVDGDCLNELVVKEGQYRKLAGERYSLDAKSIIRTTTWQWKEWGFYKIN